ncbi:uncharacterized protein JCM15063_004589 [Sporobolomyces koalae]|uniref:uncharacterized protein n=1 Tax=Sporobolomyces koalae TaxID=500713 RepID=UPI00317709FC
MLEVDAALAKPWLIEHLEPITDAEPATLADYVLALLQRDETPQELERICVESLGDFLAEHTEKFVKEMLAFVRDPHPLPPSAPSAPLAPSAPAGQAQRKRPHESESSQPNKNPRSAPQQDQPNGGNLAKGMCRDYHIRGYCARGQACPYQHDAYATSQPPPGAFPFGFPFGGPRGGMPSGPYPMQHPQQQMRHGMPQGFPMGFPPPGMNPYGGPPGYPQVGGPQNYQGGGRGGPSYPPQGQDQYRERRSGQPDQQPAPEEQQYPPTGSPNQPHGPSKRRPPPLSYERPIRPHERVKSGPPAKPPTQLTVLTHRFATNAARQKEFLAKLDTCSTPEEKKEVMSELRKLTKEADEILAMRKEIEETEKQKEQAKEKSASKSNDEASIDGGDGPSDGAKDSLEARLELLRSEAKSLGILPGSPSHGGPYKKSFAKRSYPPAAVTNRSFRLDNRSTTIVVEYEPIDFETKLEEIRKHFEPIATIKRFGFEEAGKVEVEFESRAVAEKAMSFGPPPDLTESRLRWKGAYEPPASVFPPVSKSNGSTRESRENHQMDLEEPDRMEEGEIESKPLNRARTDDDDDDERSWNR